MLPDKAVKVVNMEQPMFKKDQCELWRLCRHYGIELLAPLPCRLYELRTIDLLETSMGTYAVISIQSL